MEDFEDIFKRSKETTSTTLVDLENYVDDDRPTVTTMKKGTFFDKDSKTIRESDELRAKHIKENKTGEDITASVLLEALNSLSPHLKFTVEKQSDFDNGWLPTLDFEMKYCEERRTILYRYYQKPMRTKWQFLHSQPLTETNLNRY